MLPQEDHNILKMSYCLDLSGKVELVTGLVTHIALSAASKQTLAASTAHPCLSKHASSDQYLLFIHIYIHIHPCC